MLWFKLVIGMVMVVLFGSLTSQYFFLLTQTPLLAQAALFAPAEHDWQDKRSQRNLYIIFNPCTIVCANMRIFYLIL